RFVVGLAGCEAAHRTAGVFRQDARSVVIRHAQRWLLDSVEDPEHAFREQSRGVFVVSRESVVSEQVSVAGIHPRSPSTSRTGRGARASPGSRPRLEDDDRGPGLAAGRVAIDVVPHLAPSGPEALVLVSLGRAATDRARAIW